MKIYPGINQNNQPVNDNLSSPTKYGKKFKILALNSAGHKCNLKKGMCKLFCDMSSPHGKLYKNNFYFEVVEPLNFKLGSVSP